MSLRGRGGISAEKYFCDVSIWASISGADVLEYENNFL